MCVYMYIVANLTKQRYIHTHVYIYIYIGYKISVCAEAYLKYMHSMW